MTMSEREIKTAGTIADIGWPRGTKFCVEGGRVFWEQVDRTPTMVRLQRLQLTMGNRYRTVRVYVHPTTVLEVIRP